MWTNHPPLKRLNGLFGVWKDQEGNGMVFLVCSFLSLIPCSFLVPQSLEQRELSCHANFVVGTGIPSERRTQATGKKPTLHREGLGLVAVNWNRSMIGVVSGLTV